MKLAEVVTLYRMLERATFGKLDVAEAMKVYKMKKAMRKHVEEFDAFIMDVNEHHDLNSMSEKDKKKVDESVNQELAKDIELEFDKLSEEGAVAFVGENGWSMSLVDVFV